jgi:hypothetical protein
MVIGQVFSEPAPGAPRAAPAMPLEGLQAGIARQLAVLDDASLTGTGQSSADVLGVPGAVLADRLTSHLVREIMVRGSRGSPLTALADQLNHELTRLQGQRVESELAQLCGRDIVARRVGRHEAAGYHRALWIIFATRLGLGSGCWLRPGLAWWRSPRALCLSPPMESAVALGGLTTRVCRQPRCFSSPVP